MLSDDIRKIQEMGEQELQALGTTEALELWNVTYLGRKSALNEILKGLKDLSPEEKKTIGPLANSVKLALVQAFENREKALLEESIDWEKERIDVTAPGTTAPRGHLHPITLVEHQVEDIFLSLGFAVADGPEVETDWYNFTALNFPEDHPARDMQDTFWLASPTSSKGGLEGSKTAKERYLPRTHTTNIQVRYMQTHTPPFRIIMPGRVFRNEATDASHEHTFHQFDCLMVDRAGQVSIATFKYVAEAFFGAYFGKKTVIRLRPSYFPFTEPSFEFDISCVFCDAKGCSVCKHSGWIELGGAGMVNQKVFEAAGYKRGEYQGFAWGFGLTRLAMMKYKIPDIRLMMSGDLRFIRQF